MAPMHYSRMPAQRERYTIREYRASGEVPEKHGVAGANSPGGSECLAMQSEGDLHRGTRSVACFPPRPCSASTRPNGPVRGAYGQIQIQHGGLGS